MMRIFQIFQQASRVGSRQVYRTSNRQFSVFARQGSRSPFLELFSRRSDHQSVRHLLRRRHYSFQPEPAKTAPSSRNASPNTSASFSQRFKDLSRKYGWVAVGTYFGLSILDYPFFFLLVQSIGADRIGEYEHVTAQWIKNNVPFEIPQLPKIRWPWQAQGAEEQKIEQVSGLGAQGQETEKRKNGDGEASLASIALIAYVLHKSFIFLRIPLAVAITPKVARTLRGWGWNVGRDKAKTGAQMAAAVKQS